MTGIELLQMIKDGKLEEGTKINVFREDSKHCLIEGIARITYKNDELLWSAGTFRTSMLWNDDILFEINESKKVPSKITGIFQYSQLPSYFRDEKAINSINCNFEKHQKAINELTDAVNYLLDTQNKG